MQFTEYLKSLYCDLPVNGNCNTGKFMISQESIYNKKFKIGLTAIL